MAQHAEAKDVDKAVALVGLVKTNFASQGGDAEAIAVMGHAADDAREETAVVQNFGLRLPARSGLQPGGIADCGFLGGDRPKRRESIAQTGARPW